MAGQQQQIADTIFAMKRRLLKRDDSDTDEAEPTYGSHKQDLRRKVRYARASDPDFLLDPRPYKKQIVHAGYSRAILQHNPLRYDPDGDIVEGDDEYDEEDDLEPLEENPYADIHLERTLAPLTSAADLPNHPALSIPYSSKHLTNLVEESGALARRERITIAGAKNLFAKLQGDSSFAPTALMAMDNRHLQRDWRNGLNGHETDGTAREIQDEDMQDTIGSIHDTDMEDATQPNGVVQKVEKETDVAQEPANGAEPTTNGHSHPQTEEAPQENGDGGQTADDVSDTESQQTAHRMTTRAQAQAVDSPSPPRTPNSEAHMIHPLFKFSIDSLPDRDLGLPANEADETRMMLMAYVQKQEEVSRITTDLHQGLLEADRMRQDVFKWSKAEGHIGEMSDGEDWYDNEEWQLEHDLLKGRDEEEDDGAVAGKKSTRQRRKPDKEDR